MRRSFIRTAAVAATVVLGLSACASGSVSGGEATPTPATTAGGETTPATTGGETTAAASGDLEKVTLGMWPSSTVASFEIAKNEGIFEKHGIDLEVVLGQGSAAHLPAVSSGTMDFLIASPITPLLATERGLDVKIVSGYAVNNPDVDDDSTVVVAMDESIQSPKDLAGKRVSINALGSIGEIGIKEAVERDGGDPSSIEFVQLGLHEVAAQLDSGQIDAGMTGMPFTQGIVASGGRVVSDFIKEAELGGAELVVVGGGKTLSSKPETVKKFVAALEEALPYANEHHDEIRAILPDLLGTDPAVAENLTFMQFDAAIHTEALEQFAELMGKFDIVEERPDANAAIWQG